MNGDAMEVLLRAMAGEQVGDVIGEQEARGQWTMAHASVLPKDGSGGANRTILEAMGVQFHEDADDLFVNVTLPEGWRVVPTSHSMHSNLVDEKGHVRASIFYKAAFYDRSAHIRLRKRFSARWEPICGYGEHYQNNCLTWVERVYDGESAVWQSEPVRFANDRECYQHDDTTQQAETWLSEQYPDWKNILAYWELPSVEPATMITWSGEEKR